MTLALDDTAAGTSSNTYCSLANAEIYMEKRGFKTEWTAATNGDKNIALVWATRLLDDLIDWKGAIYSSGQALRWPRSSVYDPDGRAFDQAAIPVWLREATAEFAFHLIKEDRIAESDMKGIKYINAGEIKVVADKYDRKLFVPPAVWEKIKFYGFRTGRTIKTLYRM